MDVTLSREDLLLRWLSERVSGGGDALKSAHDWLFGSAKKWSNTVRDFEALGHLEMDWDRRRWTVGPAVMTVLPGSGLQAVLAGRRKAQMLERLETFDDLDLDVVVEPVLIHGAPTTWFIGSGTWADLTEAARVLGVYFEGRFVQSVTDALPAIDPVMTAGIRPADLGGDVFDATRLDWVHDERLADRSRAGFFRFRYRDFGPYRCIWSSGRSWAEIGMDEGRFLELSRVGRNVLTYESDGVNGRFRVPLATPLPRIHARIATISSGLLGRLDDGSHVYENVPLDVAARLASSLGQRLMGRNGRPL